MLIEKPTERIVGIAGSKTTGPTVLIVGGMHGNEPAGVLAMERLFSEINEKSPNITGFVAGIRGNISALSTGSRFQDEDLNRIWSRNRMQELQLPLERRSQEESEREALKEILDEFLQRPGPIYVIDLHTTSAPTTPFLIIDDTLVNRKFAMCFPLPVVLGLDEFLPGTMLSYYRSRGLVTIGMEGGQHEDPMAVEHCYSFLKLLLSHTGNLELNPNKLHTCNNTLKKAVGINKGVYDIWYREAVDEDVSFELLQGLRSFQKLPGGAHLGYNDQGPILVPRASRLFMPRYQPLGTDGFFLMRKLHYSVLRLAEWARRKNLGKLASYLPGMKKIDGSENCYKVRGVLLKISGKAVWHFLGYRLYSEEDGSWRMESRDQREAILRYNETEWYKKRGGHRLPSGIS